MSTDGTEVYAIVRGARRELLLRGPLTSEEIGLDDKGVETLTAFNHVFRLREDGRWQAARLPGVAELDESDRADAITAARLLLIALEAAPSGVLDSADPLRAALGDRAERVYASARDGLVKAELIAVENGKLTDRTGDLYRAPRPAFTPKWSVKETPAPLPTPSGTGHGAAPVEPEPTAPKPARVEKVAAPRVTEKVDAAEKVAVSPVVEKPKPVAAPNPDITAALTRLAVAAERQAEVLGMVVAEGRLEPSVQREEDAARDALARRICVLIGAHGSMRHGQLTAKHLSHAQRDVSWAATSYAVGLGALRKDGGHYALGDVSRLGWTAEGYAAAVKEQVDKRLRLTQQREARRREQREADAANAAIAATRDRVTGRTT